MNDNDQIAGDWRLAPEAGALGVGPSQGAMDWYSNSLGDVTTRDCLFDDVYGLNADGSYTHTMGDATWLEGWMDGVDGESCGAPVAPWDGSATASYSYDAAAGTLTVVGDSAGAHIGLSKVTNQGENGVATDNTIVYLVSDLTATSMTLDVNYGNWWRFKLVTADSWVAPAAPLTCDTVAFGTIEAECYDSAEGDVATEGDVGTGNLGWFDAGESVTYNINVPEAGNYQLSYAVASQNDGVVLNLHVGDTLADEVSFDSTGGWGAPWSDVAGRVVALAAGDQAIKLSMVAGGGNVESISLTATTADADDAPSAIPTYSVTFTVDMTAVDTDPTGVYIAGGGFGNTGLLASTEYVTMSGTIPGPDLPMVLARHAIVAINSTCSMVIGGMGYDYYASTFFYDHIEGEWTNGPSLMEVRFDHAAGLVTDEVTDEHYVAVTGGTSGGGASVSDSTEILQDGEWVQGKILIPYAIF